MTLTSNAYDYIDNGSELTIVLVHAFAMDRNLWQLQLPALKDYNILNVDVRCHGRSTEDCNAFTLEAAANDLKTIIEDEQIEDYVLVGLSLGGYIIQEFKESCGGGARGYMIVGCTPKFIDSYAPWEIYAMQMTDYVIPYLMTPLFPYLAAAVSTVTPAGYWRAVMGLHVDELKAIQSWSSMTDFHEPMDICFNGYVLVVCGVFDNFGTIRWHMADWKRAYPQAETAYIPFAGHLANLDQPALFNNLLLNFAETCKTPRLPQMV